MKTFLEWAESENLNLKINENPFQMPFQKQGATPAYGNGQGGMHPQNAFNNQNAVHQPMNSLLDPQQQGAKEYSLSDMANNITNMRWHQLYQYFATSYKTHPNDPKIIDLGQKLYQSGQYGDYSILDSIR